MKNIFSVEFFIKKNGQRGSVTVFLTMILVPMLLLMITLTDYAKISVAKRQVSGAGDVTLNAGLSYYDKTLQDMYGLFAVSKDTKELKDNLEKYFENTLLGEGIDTTDSFISKIVNIITDSKDSEDSYMNLINLTSRKFELSDITNANLLNTSLLNNQIMDYMKYRGPVVLVGGIFDKIGMFKGVNKENKAVQKKVEFEEELDKTGDKCAKAYKKIKIYNDKVKEYNFNVEGLKQFEDEMKKLYKKAITGIFLVSQNDLTKPEESKKSDKNYNIYDLSQLNNMLINIFSGSSPYMEMYNKHTSLAGDTDDYVYVANYLYSYNKLVSYFDENVRGAGDEFLRKLEDFEENLENDEELSGKAGEIENYIKYIDVQGEGFDLDYLKKQGNDSTELTNYINVLEKFCNNFKTNTEEVNNKLIEKIEKFAKNYYKLDSSYKDSGKEDEIKKCVGELRNKLQDYTKRHNQLKETSLQYDSVKEKYKRNLEYFRKIDDYSLYNAAKTKREAAISLINNDIREAKDKKNELDKHIDEIKKAAKAAAKAMDDIINAFDKLEDKKGKWQGQIDGLSGESKSSMQADLDSEAGHIDKKQAVKCKENLEEICRMLEDLQKDIEKFKFNKSDAERAARDCTDEKVNDRKAKADDYYNITYGNLGIDTKNIPKEIDKENDKFFGYLEKLYGENGNDNYKRDSEGNKEESEEKKEKEKTKDELLKIDSDPEKPVPAEGGSSRGGSAESDLANGDVDIKSKYSSPKLPSAEKDTSQEENPDSVSVDGGNISSSIGKVADSSIINNIMSFSINGCVEDIYLTEYVMNMFTYRTYNKNPDGSVIDAAGLKTLSNCEYVAKDLNGAEAEYVLWGLNTKKANLNATYTTIFGIRFLMNTIYAFMDKKVIGAETLAAATAIAGWTGFGVPIVKTALTIGLALLESKLDMDALVKGKSVPVFKDKNTWVCSLSGFANKAASELISIATEKAQEAAAAAIDKIHDCAAKNMDELSDDVKESLKNMTRDTINTVADNVTSAIENKIMGIFNYGADYASMTKDEINNEIKEWTKELKNTLGVPDSKPSMENVTDYLLYKAYNEIINTSGFITDMTNEICDNYKNAKTEEAKNLISKLEKKVDKMCGIKREKKDGKEEITEIFGINTDNLIDSAINSVNTEVQGCLDECSEAAKEKASKAISTYSEKLQNSLHKNTPAVSVTGKGTSSKSWASSVTMDYSEYLTMLLIVTGVFQNGYNNHLLRTADLIQINTGIAKGEDGEFALKNCKTHLQVNATVSGSTFFAGTGYLQKTDNIYLKESNGLYGISYNGVDGY